MFFTRTAAALLSLALIVTACDSRTEPPTMADVPAPTFDSGMVGSGNFTEASSTSDTGDDTAISDTTSARSGMVGSGN